MSLTKGVGANAREATYQAQPEYQGATLAEDGRHRIFQLEHVQNDRWISKRAGAGKRSIKKMPLSKVTIKSVMIPTLYNFREGVFSRKKINCTSSRLLCSFSPSKEPGQ